MRRKLGILVTVAVISSKVLGQTYSVLHNFTGTPDGYQPLAGLVLSGNLLFGTTSGGGANGQGTIFRINTNGSDYAIIKSFSSEGFLTSDLVLSGGTFYGTASGGGTGEGGVVFSIATDGSGYTILKQFGNDGPLNFPNGLALKDNTLYGTTYGTVTPDGSEGCGTVFKVNTNGSEFAVLKYFSPAQSYGVGFTNSDGAYPLAGLVIGEGTLYGTTRFGGDLGVGTVFSVSTNGSDYTVLRGFGFADGYEPQASLLLDGNVLYGTTTQSQLAFKIQTNGNGFTAFGFGISSSHSGLILSSNVLYGTTRGGGSSSLGVVFKFNTDGSGFTVLKHFRGMNGSHPMGSLVLSGGVLYGTTEGGGSKGHGVVFKLDLTSPPNVTLQSLAVAAGKLSLSWNAIYGELYQIQSLGDLSQTNWISATGTITATNTIMTRSVSLNPFEAQRFYRVVYLP